jgi:pyruvate dehydrogenase E1 component
VVPGIRIAPWTRQFEAAGRHVLELKYGPRLAEAFRRPNGERLRERIDSMPNEQYQSLFGRTPSQLRDRFLDGAPENRPGSGK